MDGPVNLTYTRGRNEMMRPLVFDLSICLLKKNVWDDRSSSSVFRNAHRMIRTRASASADWVRLRCLLETTADIQSN
jgi:hypothetical protein